MNRGAVFNFLPAFFCQLESSLGQGFPLLYSMLIALFLMTELQTYMLPVLCSGILGRWHQ
jgi:hypothetical protein